MQKGLMWLLSAAIISGISIYINKFAVSTVSPVAFTLMKNSAVALLFLALIFGVGGVKQLRLLKPKAWLQLALVGFIGGGIPFILFFKGLALTSAASASFIHKGLFVFVILFTWIFLRERPSPWLGVSGLALLAGNFFLLNMGKVIFGFGDVLVLLAAVMWAGEFILSKKILADVPPRVLGFGRMFFGSLTILAYAFAFEGGIPAAAFGLESIKWIAITGVFLFAYVATWYNGLARESPSVAAVVLMLGSPVTTLLSVASGSTITQLQWFGFGLMLAGVAAILPKALLLRTPDAQ